MDANDGQVDHAAPQHEAEEVLPPAALHDVMMGNPQLPDEAVVADSTAQADDGDEEEVSEEELAEGELVIGRAQWCGSACVCWGGSCGCIVVTTSGFEIP